MPPVPKIRGGATESPWSASSEYCAASGTKLKALHNAG
jgi:hypothetical protein